MGCTTSSLRAGKQIDDRSNNHISKTPTTDTTVVVAGSENSVTTTPTTLSLQQTQSQSKNVSLQGIGKQILALASAGTSHESIIKATKIVPPTTEASLPLPKVDEFGRLLTEEIVRRSRGSIMSKQVMLGSQLDPIIAEFAHWSLRGYDASNPRRTESQDESHIVMEFAHEKSPRSMGALFGLYTDDNYCNDHDMVTCASRSGICARYLRDHLSLNVAKSIQQKRTLKYEQILTSNQTIKQQKSKVKQSGCTASTFVPDNWPLLSVDEYQDCCRQGFDECNQAMRQHPKVQMDISKTSVITVTFHNDFVTVCSLGGGHVILGEVADPEASTVVVDNSMTSVDQEDAPPPDHDWRSNYFPDDFAGTEERKEEDTYPDFDDDIFMYNPSGDDDQHHQRSGLNKMLPMKPQDKLIATRLCPDNISRMKLCNEDCKYVTKCEESSLADSITKKKSHSPKINSAAITPSNPFIVSFKPTWKDRMIVIGSKGLFNVLDDDQSIIDICSQHHDYSSNPLMASEAIVQHAYYQCCKNKTGTTYAFDDISVVVIFLDCTSNTKSLENDPR